MPSGTQGPGPAPVPPLAPTRSHREGSRVTGTPATGGEATGGDGKATCLVALPPGHADLLSLQGQFGEFSSQSSVRHGGFVGGFAKGARSSPRAAKLLLNL